MITLALLLASASATACDLSAITSDRAAHDAFAQRAIEVIVLASASSPAEDRLSKLVEPTAPFSLGAGDVGSPLGSGVSGVIAVAKRMKANEYRFLSWDYMSAPANACGKGEVEVEFLDRLHNLVSQVKFSFEHGRVINAQGLQRSDRAGPLALPTGD